MSEGLGTDKLAKVRDAGETIRNALAENMKARLGDVVDQEAISETRDALAAVLRMYLEQIMPKVQVKGLSKIKPNVENPEKIEFEMTVTGKLSVSIEPGAEDDTLPDPEPAEGDDESKNEEPPKS